MRVASSLSPVAVLRCRSSFGLNNCSDLSATPIEESEPAEKESGA
jgi:hypothetical protein